jgi:hypothetical protein
MAATSAVPAVENADPHGDLPCSRRRVSWALNWGSASKASSMVGTPASSNRRAGAAVGRRVGNRVGLPRDRRARVGY